MADRDETSPPAAELRQQRLAEALRANLHRRKAQARARDGRAETPEGGTSEGKAETCCGDKPAG